MQNLRAFSNINQQYDGSERRTQPEPKSKYARVDRAFFVLGEKLPGTPAENKRLQDDNHRL